MIALVSGPTSNTSGAPGHSRVQEDDGSDSALMVLKDAVSSARTGGSNPRCSSFAWISLDEATPAEIDEVASAVGLDDFLLENALSPQQRPKIDTRPGEIFMIMKTLSWIPSTLDVETGQVAVFIGPGYAITRHSGERLHTADMQQRLIENPQLRSSGPISVAWAVADVAVDGYLIVGEAIETEIERIEEDLFAEVPAELASRIYRLNRENIEMRRAVRPLLPVSTRLMQGTQEEVPEDLRTFFQDIGDHLLRANDMVDAYDTALMTMLMASTARQDLQQNRDMRKIAAWAAIFAVPTAIAGIYGMNFDVMPELHWTFGYPSVLAIMGGICFVLYRAFRRSGWV